jgi:hypothetical protein
MSETGGNGGNGGTGRNDEAYRVLNVPRDHVLRACETVYWDRPKLRETAIKAHAHLSARRWTVTQVEQNMGLTAMELRRFLLGGGVDVKMADMEATAVAVEKFFAKMGNPDSPVYCETRYTKIMERVARAVARRSGRGETNAIAYVNGPSHCGKSLVYQHLCHVNGWFYCSVKPMGGPQAVMRDLSRRFGVGVYASQYIVLQRLYDSLRPGDVVVINQCDRLVRRRTDIQEAVDLAWDLAENTSAGIIFVDTDGKFKRHLDDCNYDASQFWNRCVRIVELPNKANEAEVRALFKFRCPDLEMDECWLQNAMAVNDSRSTGFGAVAKIINDAEDFAEFKGRGKVGQGDLNVALWVKMVGLKLAIPAEARRKLEQAGLI